jgi:hypothetical protein
MVRGYYGRCEELFLHRIINSYLMPELVFWSWNKISDAAIKILEILIGD